MDKRQNPVKPTQKRRARWHNYRDPGTYMLTLVTEGRVRHFGHLSDIPVPHIELSELGATIIEHEIKKIHSIYSNVYVWKLCVMPDHLHLIVRVDAPFAKGKSLGNVVYGFKTGCTRAWWSINGWYPDGKPSGTVAQPTSVAAYDTPAPIDAAPNSTGATVLGGSPSSMVDSSNQSTGATVLGGSPSSMVDSSNQSTGATVLGGSPPRLPLLFEEGYNDRLLYRPNQLEAWRRYLDDNPRRALLKRANPHFFTILHDYDVAGHKCQVVGNRFLLDIPDKVAVIVHRADDDITYNQKCNEWLACGERGGVLVSAAIAPREKAVMREAMNRGYCIILLRENGFPKLYKPGGEAFDACHEGRMLQISPWEYHNQQRTITRAQCLSLNNIAESIAQKQYHSEWS